jgi:hypothetical protein
MIRRMCSIGDKFGLYGSRSRLSRCARFRFGRVDAEGVVLLPAETLRPRLRPDLLEDLGIMQDFPVGILIQRWWAFKHGP